MILFSVKVYLFYKYIQIRTISDSIVTNIRVDFLIRLIMAKFTDRNELNINRRFGEVYQ